MPRALDAAPTATLAGLVVHYLFHYWRGTPLATDFLAEWIMARTPSHYAVAILESLGPWAKPFAATGGLAALGCLLFVAAGATPRRWSAAGPLAAGAALTVTFPLYASFWVPAFLALAWMVRPPALPDPRRRAFLASAAMGAGTLAVAGEAYLRNERFARRAVTPVPLFPFTPPPDRFAPGLVRKIVTPTPEFYGMSKNTVDPAIDPREWRLKITIDGRTLRELRYAELTSLPRTDRYVTLRCISNTLQSDLMGTALWTGFRGDQIVDRRALPPSILEAAIIGVDGHGDSVPLDYFFSEDVLLAIGMNGMTLDRTHGFPLRLLVPRYYGFKNVKWIGEIAFVSRPYFGMWPKMGYTKDAYIHTASHIDRLRPSGEGLEVGGVSFAGSRGIRAVRLRADGGPWVDATLEPPLSPYTWTRWYGVLPAESARQVEARAQDGEGNWQAEREGRLFPSGMSGPTIRRVRS